VSWRDGGVLLRIAVRPWDTPFGVQGRLTFSAGTIERLARIARESTRHGFHRVTPKATDTVLEKVTELVVEKVGPLAAGLVPAQTGPDTADDIPVTLRTVSGFEVVLVTS
jgi:hypothetical protein